MGTCLAYGGANVPLAAKRPDSPPKPSAFAGSRYWVSGFPNLVQEWDVDRNGILTPETVPAGSGRKIWWKCLRGSDHSWRATPNNRTLGTGCPFCTNRKVSETNSLETCFPRVAAEWHPVRNGDVAASQVMATSARIAWWCCSSAGHEWRASIRDRTRRQTDCPYCAHRRASNEASLAESHPALSHEWHPTQNGDLSPREVLAGSNRRVWWQCGREPAHAWPASISNRVLRASGCPHCAHRRASAIA
jgi:Probable Zinc-ribbon domain